MIKNQWTHENVDKASDKNISETSPEYLQCELHENDENLEKYLTSLYLAETPQVA